MGGAVGLPVGSIKGISVGATVGFAVVGAIVGSGSISDLSSFSSFSFCFLVGVWVG